MAMILAREDAISHWRDVMGPTKTTKYESKLISIIQKNPIGSLTGGVEMRVPPPHPPPLKVEYPITITTIVLQVQCFTHSTEHCLG
jgi:hypothetical protein